MTPLRAFSCSDCQWRGWRWPVASTGVVLPPLTDPARVGPSPKGLKRGPVAKLPEDRKRERIVATFILILVGIAAFIAWKGFD